MRGLAPLVRAEMAGWWRTRRWLVTTLAWVLAINAALLVMILDGRSETEADRQAKQEILRATLEAQAGKGSAAAQAQLERMDAGREVEGPSDSLMWFSIVAGVFGAIGSVLTLQGAVIGEKKSGTAEWVLSGPVTRSAFVLAKLAGNALGVLATSVAIPAAVAWIELTALEGLGLPPLGFLAGTGIIALHVLFYLTLALMLGVLLDHWAPVVGIPLAVFAVQNFAMGLLPALAGLVPWGLVLPTGGQESVVASLMLGTAPATLAPVVATGACVVLFSVVAVLGFRRQEFWSPSAPPDRWDTRC
jgi:hypothetical protein